MRSIPAACAALLLLAGPAAAAEVFVDFGSPIVYLANDADPGLGLDWVEPEFDSSGWSDGTYGIGYDDDDAATALFATTVPSGTRSIYTIARFEVGDAAAVERLYFAADYDDGCAAWLNGIEVYRSPELPAGTLAWDAAVESHESGNGVVPSFGDPVDLSASALDLLVDGENVLAVAVWNTGTGSSDLVLVPRLVADPLEISRGPYLQSSTATSTRVRWRTLAETESRVEFGMSPGALTSAIDGLAATTEHELVIDGLAAATRYYYRVRDSRGEYSPVHSLLTLPETGSPAPLRVWVLGDSGRANTTAFAVRDAYLADTGGDDTHLLLMLGDNAYESGTDAEFQATLFDPLAGVLASSSLWPTFGNHDGASADAGTQSGPYFENFSLPAAGEAGGAASGTEAYYSFDAGNVHFICLDSHESERAPGAAMLDWLGDDLASAAAATWRIAYWHHPPYSKGSHDSDSESQLIEMREYVLPILEAGGVDLVLCGHSHGYERTALIDGHYEDSSTFAPEMSLDGGDGRIEGDGPYRKASAEAAPNEGTVYVVAGSSSRVSSDGALDHPAMHTSLREAGSLVLEVAGNRLDVRFLLEDGATGDRFSIVKGAGALFVRGDVNGDGALDISDPILLLRALFLAASAPCEVAQDANDDETRGLADALVLLDRLFRGGAPLPPPTRCAPDPTVDATVGALDCDTPPTCE